MLRPLRRAPRQPDAAREPGRQRYFYRATRLSYENPLGPATPAFVVAAGAREVALIEVQASYGGFSAEGLRTRESEFYATLATLAGELGGERFVVLRATHAHLAPHWITSLTVAVVAAPQG